MPVIGMKFDSIEGKRGNETPRGEIKVNSTPKITSIKEVDIAPFGKKALAVNFDFSTNYTPNIGEIRITGEILYTTDLHDKVLKEWKDKKTIPETASIEILNHLFRHCLLKIVNISEDLQLPPPISLPRVRPKQKEKP